MMNKPGSYEIIETKSGVKSLRLIANQETFHPDIGPMAEANLLHVEQHRLAERSQEAGRIILWDVGLGAAANAIAAIEAMANPKAEVEIHSFDISPSALLFALENQDQLAYLRNHESVLKLLVKQGFVRLHPNMVWYFHEGDFREEMLRTDLPSPHAMFYDPYSPRSNTEMWTLEHFRRLKQRLDPKEACMLSNYTRATHARVTWLLAGFFVGIGIGIGFKEETSLAATHQDLLAQPLLSPWLKRVKGSPSAAPLRRDSFERGPITAEDFALLQQHPQFLA